LERYAREKGYTVVRNIYIQLYDENDKPIGGAQMEIDALLVGLDSVKEIVDVKFDSSKVSPSGQQRNLSFYYRKDLLYNLSERARAFGGLGEEKRSRIRNIGVIAGGEKMTLEEFQTSYPRTTPVSVVGLSTIPDTGPISPGTISIGTITGLTQANVIQLIADAIKKHL
jgi:hypothetical protein